MLLTKIQILVAVTACALITATVTVCFVHWHQAQQQADDAAAVRQAIYRAMKPPATAPPPAFM